MATITNPIIDIDRDTGDFISGWARIKQSIVTILTTRLKTRLMRLWWGSEFMDLQDKPGTQEVFLRSIYAAVVAINEYEPEYKVTQIRIPEWGADGVCQIEIYGIDLTSDDNVSPTRVVVTF